MNRVSWALTLALLLFAASVQAQKLPEIPIEKYTLSNGLQVVLHEDHTIPAVTVNIWYHVGSKNEKPGKTGFAHLFEHMMFEGSEHHPGDYSFEKVGGEDNASTSEDRTNYHETVPSNYLEQALWMESDRMGYLTGALTQEKLDNQRDVVKNERRQRMDNQPYAKSYELMLSLLYPPQHPYSWPVIGSMEDLSKASVDDVKDFFKTYYVPNNASLCIAGDFDKSQAKQFVEKYFGGLPAGAPIDRMTSWVPKLDGVKRIKAEDRVNLARYQCSWPSPASFAAGDAELDLLAVILADGKTSRLYKAMVYDKQIAQDVSAYQESNEICGAFNVDVKATPGHNLAEMEKASDDVIRELIEKGVTPDELKQAQTAYAASFVKRLQRSGSVADQINRYNTMLGDPSRFQWDLDRYLKVTPADIQRVAREVLDFNRRAIVNIVPQGEFETEGADADRSALPGPTAEPKFSPPAIQTATLSNGLKVLLVEKHTLPIVQVNIALKSGWASDPAGKVGVAKFTNKLLEDGTKSRTTLQLDIDSKKIGADLGSGSSFDGSYVSLNVLKDHLDEGLVLLSDMVLNPTFPQAELDREKQTAIGDLMQEAKQPTSLASRAFNKLLFGAGHPYAQPSSGSGSEASIKALTRDDLVNFYKSHYMPNNAGIILVGDMTLAEATPKLEKMFKDWKPGTVPTQEIPEAKPLTSTSIYLVDKPGAPQSVVFVGNLGMKRTDPDRPAMEVVNSALGGKFTSRLNMNLRQKKGYTYGAGSGFGSRRGTGAFLCYAMVQTPSTDKSILEFIKELKDVSDTRPVAGDELKESKDNIIKGYPQDFETYHALGGLVNTIYMCDLPLDEWTKYVGKVNTVDDATAAQVAKAHIHPDHLLIVVVGDRSKVEADLKKLNLGDVHIMTATDL